MTHPVYLVRHGQSEWNLRRLTQGQTVHPRLTELGREQARCAAALISGDLAALALPVTRIISSDLVRATQTAGIHSGHLGAEVKLDARLREQNLGALEGRSYEESWAVAAQTDWSDSTTPVAGGESAMDVYDRMGAVLRELDRGTVSVLVSHADAIRGAVAYLRGVKPHEAPWVDVSQQGRRPHRRRHHVAWTMTSMPNRTTSLEAASFAGVTLVGAGPGDPDLITVAGLKALLGADVVVTDRLVPRELLAGLNPDVELIDVAKFPRSRFTAQEDINAVLLDRARAGKNVVRLKGGDSYVFGRGFEEMLHMQHAGVPVRVIPGLSSSISVPALAGIPVTHRGVVHEFTVVSGHVAPGHPDSLVNWVALAASKGTIILLMAVQNAGEIAEALVAGGRDADQPAAVIADGSLASERVIRTSLVQLAKAIEAEEVRPPAIIIIGDVAGL